MADGDTYLLKSLVFTPVGGGGAVTIDALEDISIEDSSQVIAHGAGNNFCVLAHFCDNGEGRVNARSRNQSLLANAGLRNGIVGSLVATYQKRAAGKGGVAGQDRTITAAQAMVANPNASLPRADRGEISIEFHCSDAAGVAAFAFGSPA